MTVICYIFCTPRLINHHGSTVNYYLKQTKRLHSHVNLTQIKYPPSQLAQAALIKEISLSPKPGLVDRDNNGSHTDMNFDTFIESINAISPWLDAFYLYGLSFNTENQSSFLSGIRPIGIDCEKAMFRATHNVNTHKGGIFAFGLLLGAIGKLEKEGQITHYQTICNEVAAICSGIVSQELEQQSAVNSMGEKLFKQHKLTGARGEAESGYRTVRDISFPIFNEMIDKGYDEETSLLQAMLYLLAYNEDTNLVSRGGVDGLYFVQESAKSLISRGGMLQKEGRQYLQDLDQELIKRNLSPGGTADLIAITWFLSQFK